MNTIERIEKISKRKKSKSRKLIEFLWNEYHKNSKNIFYRFNKRWFHFVTRDVRDELDVSVGLINKVLTLLKSEELVEYEYISFLGYGVRRNPHDSKCLHFTPKGIALFNKLIGKQDYDIKDNDGSDCYTDDPEESDSKCEKSVSTFKSKASYKDNNIYNKSLGKNGFSRENAGVGDKTPIFTSKLKTAHQIWCSEESLTARGWRKIQEIVPEFRDIRLTRGISRYVHAAINKLACKKKIGLNISSTEIINRLAWYVKQQMKWIQEHGIKLTLHVLLCFKGIGAFLFRIFRGKDYIYGYKKYTPKSFENKNLEGVNTKTTESYTPEFTPSRNSFKHEFDARELDFFDNFQEKCNLYGRENIIVSCRECECSPSDIERYKAKYGESLVIKPSSKPVQSDPEKQKNSFNIKDVISELCNSWKQKDYSPSKINDKKEFWRQQLQC